jgi:hypothetical protein
LSFLSRAPAAPIERTGNDGITTENEFSALLMNSGPRSIWRKAMLNPMPGMRLQQVEPWRGVAQVAALRPIASNYLQ